MFDFSPESQVRGPFAPGCATTRNMPLSACTDPGPQDRTANLPNNPICIDDQVQSGGRCRELKCERRRDAEHSGTNRRTLARDCRMSDCLCLGLRAYYPQPEQATVLNEAANTHHESRSAWLIPYRAECSAPNLRRFPRPFLLAFRRPSKPITTP